MIHEMITGTDMKLSYAKTPCLLDTKLSEQSELLKTLRCEAYAEFTQSENGKQITKKNMRTPHWNQKAPQCHRVVITSPLYNTFTHTREFDLSFSLRRSVGIAPHMETKGTEDKGPHGVHTGPI